MVASFRFRLHPVGSTLVGGLVAHPFGRPTFSGSTASSRHRYVNYMDRDEGEIQVALAYGPNYARLREVKVSYDPENVFHMNQNVRSRS